MTKMDINYLFIEPVVSKFLFRKKGSMNVHTSMKQLQLLSESHIHFEGHPPWTCSPVKRKTSNCWHACNTDI